VSEGCAGRAWRCSGTSHHGGTAAAHGVQESLVSSPHVRDVTPAEEGYTSVFDVHQGRVSRFGSVRPFLWARQVAEGDELDKGLYKTTTGFLLKIVGGTLVVELVKALYTGAWKPRSCGTTTSLRNWSSAGTGEANKTLYSVMNEMSPSRHVQTTIERHADDIFVTSESQEALDELDLHPKSQYEETARHPG